MNVLFCASPGVGHFLPMVPTAWALRAAGHDVLVATTGPALAAAAAAGLSVADAARDTDIAGIFRGYMSELGDQPPDDPFRSTLRLFGRISDAMVDGTVELARAWRPDVVVYGAMQGAGWLAARVLGVPGVHHGIGLGLSHDEIALLRDSMTATERFDESTDAADAVIDMCPASMRRAQAATGWPARFVPYGGGGRLADWLLRPPSRPRILVTLGSVLPRMVGLEQLPDLVKAVGELPVDVVLALGDGAPGGAEPLPDNIRTVGWLPLSVLLRGCAAIIHHGGTGTTFHALAAGVPQLALPRIGDQHRTAAAIASRGLGLEIGHDRLHRAGAREAVERLLDDTDMRSAAADVRTEISRQPAPADLVSLLTEKGGKA